MIVSMVCDRSAPENAMTALMMIAIFFIMTIFRDCYLQIVSIGFSDSKDSNGTLHFKFDLFFNILLHNKTGSSALFTVHEGLALCVGCREAGKGGVKGGTSKTLSLRGHPLFLPPPTAHRGLSAKAEMGDFHNVLFLKG